MTAISFPQEPETHVKIAMPGFLIVKQIDDCDDTVIVFWSKARAIEVANAILALAEKCPWEQNEGS